MVFEGGCALLGYTVPTAGPGLARFVPRGTYVLRPSEKSCNWGVSVLVGVALCFC